MFTTLHHIGVVVRNLDEAIKLYSNIFHLTPSDIKIRTYEEKGLRTCLFRIGSMIIELLEPSGVENRYAKHLRENGEGLFHLCIFTDSFDTEVSLLKEKGYKVEEETNTKISAGYAVKLAWLSGKETTGVWIELVDASTHPPIS